VGQIAPGRGREAQDPVIVWSRAAETACTAEWLPGSVPIVPTGVGADEFIDRGFVRPRDAFPSSLAERCVAALWEATGRRRDDSSTWDAPVVRLGYRDDSLFVEAATTPALHAAFDYWPVRVLWWPRPNIDSSPSASPPR
jgi:hypothetical protein